MIVKLQTSQRFVSSFYHDQHLTTMTILSLLTCSAAISQKVWAGLMVERAGKMSHILTR